ncbi:uncharacterized protein LOC130641359 [Hydractinia symbiolongicarpus]|uniref:uncharacterized protein LOC130641359 n=1 Tax=Hydractinia symbiolongicarpus TaxID=13093 RepID=UPI00255109C5|nr:uncharacterized protein LOC130641359 [Hydractinia symbiolongicarpus]
MYMRSLEKHNIRYLPFIGDGDSSSFRSVESLMPYGPLVNIEKHECVNHITKRMGTGLRSLLKEFKGRKLSDGKSLGGRGGGLTIAKCDVIQNFYGKSIRDNKGDAKAMSEAVWAILEHYSSSSDEPRHQRCPVGPTSWCSYNRDLCLGTNAHKPLKNPLRPAVRETLIPLFTRLANQEFLEGVKQCYTQNPNESLHHLIWTIVPKEQNNSPEEISLGISLGVCIFNSGINYTLTSLFKKCSLQYTETMSNKWKAIDNERIKNAEYKNQETVKLRRKEKKRSRCKKQDAFQRQEGTQYKSGAFQSNCSTRGRGSKRKKK